MAVFYGPTFALFAVAILVIATMASKVPVSRESPHSLKSVWLGRPVVSGWRQGPSGTFEWENVQVQTGDSFVRLSESPEVTRSCPAYLSISLHDNHPSARILIVSTRNGTFSLVYFAPHGDHYEATFLARHGGICSTMVRPGGILIIVMTRELMGLLPTRPPLPRTVGEVEGTFKYFENAQNFNSPLVAVRLEGEGMEMLYRPLRLLASLGEERYDALYWESHGDSRCHLEDELNDSLNCNSHHKETAGRALVAGAKRWELLAESADKTLSTDLATFESPGTIGVIVEPVAFGSVAMPRDGDSTLSDSRVNMMGGDGDLTPKDPGTDGIPLLVIAEFYSQPSISLTMKKWFCHARAQAGHHSRTFSLKPPSDGPYFSHAYHIGSRNLETTRKAWLDQTTNVGVLVMRNQIICSDGFALRSLTKKAIKATRLDPSQWEDESLFRSTYSMSKDGFGVSIDGAKGLLVIRSVGAPVLVVLAVLPGSGGGDTFSICALSRPNQPTTWTIPRGMIIAITSYQMTSLLPVNFSLPPPVDGRGHEGGLVRIAKFFEDSIGQSLRESEHPFSPLYFLQISPSGKDGDNRKSL